MTVLVVAAHPDDEILGCGGLINKYKKQGIDSYVLILTDGILGRYSENSKKLLKKDALVANKLIGTHKVFFKDFPNQMLDVVPLTKIVKVIEKHINDLNIDCLFTHHAGDLNKDHRIVYEAAITAARPIPKQKIKALYTYSVPSSTEWNKYEKNDIFMPNCFVDISREIEKKIKAMECYKSECKLYPHPRSLKGLRAYAKYYGLSVGLEYCEPFKLIRTII